MPCFHGLCLCRGDNGMYSYQEQEALQGTVHVPSNSTLLVHFDAQKLGQKTVLHSRRPTEQVFVYSTAGVRGITPPQTHLSSLVHIVVAFILFSLMCTFYFPILHIATHFLITWLCKPLQHMRGFCMRWSSASWWSFLMKAHKSSSGLNFSPLFPVHAL